MGGAHDICGVSFQRLLVGVADERLRREVEHEIRLDAEDGFFHRFRLPHVAGFVADELGDVQLFKQRWLGGRRQGEAVDFGAQLHEPAREPRAFEAGVAGEPDGLALECVGEHHQIFQGALPSAQSLFRYCVS